MDTTRAELVVDVGAIRRNVELLSALVAPDGAAMMTVVKADGYGHGLLEAARAARSAGAPWLGVATIDEALALRAGGDTGRVLCWLTVPGEDYAAPIAAEVDLSVYSTAELGEVVQAVTDRPAQVQIKVDTGLSRGGAPREQWHDLFAMAAGLEGEGRIRVTGVWSHLACSDDPDDPANDEQERLFTEALYLAASAGLDPEVRHLANSAAAILRPSARFDLVRCGIASYGLDPAPGATPPIGLRPAMSVRVPLALTKTVQPGAAVSYGRTWTATSRTTLGLVPLGYADGVPRIAGNRAEVWVAGGRRPVRGRVCMDQLVVDLGTDDPGAGAEAVLIGPGDQGEPTAQDWAEACDTISYEIVTRLGAQAHDRPGSRLRRRHVDSHVDSEVDSEVDSKVDSEVAR